VQKNRAADALIAANVASFCHHTHAAHPHWSQKLPSVAARIAVILLDNKIFMALNCYFVGKLLFLILLSDLMNAAVMRLSKRFM
jgi:hypothetical protein